MAPAGAGPGTVVELHFPKGYSYERGTHTLFTPSGRNYAALPPYVTGITLTISGEGMETADYPVNLSTLGVSFTVTPGVRTFTITVHTSIGLTFTDSVTIEVVSGAPINLTFNLNINAPPSGVSATASPSVAQPGDVIALSCSATDLDPEDVLAYKWGGPGGWSASGPNVSYTIPGYGVFRFVCAVSDGWGGVAEASAEVRAPKPNEPPYITSFQMLDYSTQTPGTSFWGGTWVSIKCDGKDPENDPLTYQIFGTTALIASGPYVDKYQLPNDCAQANPYYAEYACFISDGHNSTVGKGLRILLSPAC
jgi:hypothetical protein